MDFKNEISEILSSESPDIVAASKLITSKAVTIGKLSGSTDGDSIQLTSQDESFSIQADKAEALFRMILARLGTQAKELTGQDLNLYESESEYEWEGEPLHQMIENQPGSLSFSIEKVGC